MDVIGQVASLFAAVDNSAARLQLTKIIAKFGKAFRICPLGNDSGMCPFRPVSAPVLPKVWAVVSQIGSVAWESTRNCHTSLFLLVFH